MEQQQFNCRKATAQDVGRIWEILQQAIERRRLEGSQQWQDGYPNPNTLAADLDQGVGFVAEAQGAILAYFAVIENHEPAYDAIDGKWLTDGTFIVLHRVAVAAEYLGKGYAEKILNHVEVLAQQRGIASIRADTNFDNPAMLHLFEKLGYTYCGEVYFRGAPRMAYEKPVV